MKTLTVDDRHRVTLPQVLPGQVFTYEPDLDGSIKLVPVVAKRSPKRILARLVQRDGGMFFEVPKGYKLDPEAIGRAVAEERERRSTEPRPPFFVPQRLLNSLRACMFKA